MHFHMHSSRVYLEHDIMQMGVLTSRAPNHSTVVMLPEARKPLRPKKPPDRRADLRPHMSTEPCACAYLSTAAGSLANDRTCTCPMLRWLSAEGSAD